MSGFTVFIIIHLPPRSVENGLIQNTERKRMHLLQYHVQKDDNIYDVQMTYCRSSNVVKYVGKPHIQNSFRHSALGYCTECKYAAFPQH